MSVRPSLATDRNMSMTSSMTTETLVPGSLWPAVALVTGAGGDGIGAAVAMAFAEAGCRAIAITDIDGKKLLKTKDEIIAKYQAVTVLTATGNIADEAFVNSFVDGVIKEAKRLDFAVNCAGISSNNKLSTETPTADFDRINDINYRGCWLSSRAELRAMMRQDPLQTLSRDPSTPPQRGAIVNIASSLGVTGRSRSTAYAASKAAVITMTRADATDYGPHGIRVNCVSPGLIISPGTTMAPTARTRLDEAARRAPLQRVGSPQEVSDAVIFLCSRKASFMTGQNLVVDGGAGLGFSD